MRKVGPAAAEDARRGEEPRRGVARPLGAAG